jgi:hypothetical protein
LYNYDDDDNNNNLMVPNLDRMNIRAPRNLGARLNTLIPGKYGTF